MNTQIEGLLAIETKAPAIRQRVVNLFTQCGPLTDPELVQHFAAAWGYDNYRSIGARRRELVLAGVVQDTGDRKVNPMTNVRNIVWDLV